MRFLFLFLPLLLFADISDQRIKLLEERISQLENETNSTLSDLRDMGAVVDSVERKTFTDILDFTPEVRLRFDKMHYEVGQFEPISTPSADSTIARNRDDFEKNFGLASSVRFRLNMHANASDNMSFHGRVVFQHSTQSNERLCVLSRDIKSSGSISGLDIDRAYFDYKLNTTGEYPFVFSFGVLPTSGGIPMQYAEVRARQSVFPALVFDMDSYGLILTSELTHLFGGKSFLRAIAAQAYTLDSDIYPYQCNRETIDNADIYGLYFDTRLTQHVLFSAGVNVLHDFKAHPYLGPDVTADNADNLGTMVTFGLGLDVEDFAQSGLSMFLHTAVSHGHSNGNNDSYKTDPMPGELGYTGVFTASDYATGSLITDPGYSVYTGFLYDMTSSWTFGGEYNYGSKYWFAATQGAEDMYNKLATRGHVGEGYLIWKLNRNLFTKVGYMYAQEDYTGSGWHFGEPIAKGGKQQVGYVQLNASF
ncbi:MAG: DUF3373 family protein [Helicobacteraceae bacterium]|nr:DUF3373 family protein [Helicobacteraceae bacterium]